MASGVETLFFLRPLAAPPAWSAARPFANANGPSRTEAQAARDCTEVMCELEHVRLKLSKTPLLLCCRMELPAFPAPHWSMSGVLGRAASLPAFVRRLASAAINVNVWRRAQSTSSPSATAIDLYAGRRALLVVVGGDFCRPVARDGRHPVRLFSLPGSVPQTLALFPMRGTQSC